MIIDNISLSETTRFYTAIYNNCMSMFKRGVSASIVVFDTKNAVVTFTISTKSGSVNKEMLITYDSVNDNWIIFGNMKRFTCLSLTQISGIAKQLINNGVANKTKI